MRLSKKEMALLIKKARNIKGEKIGQKFTQVMLAKEIGISQSYLGDIESARIYPNYTILIKIAKICEVDLQFFGIEDNLEVIYNQKIDVLGTLRSIVKSCDTEKELDELFLKVTEMIFEEKSKMKKV